jgi:hypothetical protein
MTLPIRITQAELREITELERELPWKRQHLEEMKGSVMALLQAGAPIEEGRFDAKIVMRVGRAVPWRQLLVERIGQVAADLLKRQFKTHVYPEVRVMEHAVPPLWQGNTRTDEAER